MENSARYTLIGAFALACLVAAFSFVYWIKNVGGLGQRALYEIRFEQPVSGLAIGASVLFNGVRAGAVTRIALDPNAPKRVTVTASLDPETPVRADTVVDISYQGLTGAAAVALKGGAADSPPADVEQWPAAVDHRGLRCWPQPDRVGAGNAAPHRRHPRPECEAAEYGDHRASPPSLTCLAAIRNASKVSSVAWRI